MQIYLCLVGFDVGIVFLSCQKSWEYFSFMVLASSSWYRILAYKSCRTDVHLRCNAKLITWSSRRVLECTSILFKMKHVKKKTMQQQAKGMADGTSVLSKKANHTCCKSSQEDSERIWKGYLIDINWPDLTWIICLVQRVRKVASESKTDSEPWSSWRMASDHHLRLRHSANICQCITWHVGGMRGIWNVLTCSSLRSGKAVLRQELQNPNRFFIFVLFFLESKMPAGIQSGAQIAPAHHCTRLLHWISACILLFHRVPISSHMAIITMFTLCCICLGGGYILFTIHFDHFAGSQASGLRAEQDSMLTAGSVGDFWGVLADLSKPKRLAVQENHLRPLGESWHKTQPHLHCNRSKQRQLWRGHPFRKGLCSEDSPWNHIFLINFLGVHASFWASSKPCSCQGGHSPSQQPLGQLLLSALHCPSSCRKPQATHSLLSHLGNVPRRVALLHL